MSSQFNEIDSDVSNILLMLESNNLLTPENRIVVITHTNPIKLINAVAYLQQLGALTQATFSVVANHADPYGLARALFILQEAGILTEENFAIVAQHSDPRELAYALSYLQRAGILTEANFAIVAYHARPSEVARALYSLERAGILTEANRALVAHHFSPIEQALALCYLRQAGILTRANRDVFAHHANPGNLARALSSLQQAGILTEANFAVVADHANPLYLERTLLKLQQAGILTEANFAVVIHHTAPGGLAFALYYLQQAGILTEANFAVLVAPDHAALVSEEARQLIWYRLPNHRLTQANFERLVIASEHANPMVELQRIVNQILGVQAQVGHAALFNPNQSTHTASVHRSVSESARKLMTIYGHALNLEAKIAEIKTFINGLDDSFKYSAAKRCIERITAPDYTFTDSSGVSTRQLLALAYTAIHDEDKRQGSLDDAKALFIEGLYEIQRGYNQSANGIDNQNPDDAYICPAGTFNKLMEKLHGIHSDVEVYFITHEGAYAKFPKLVAHHTLNYLNGLARPETATDYLSIKELLDSMKDNGIEPIWDKIKAAVEAELWSEFKEAYANNPNHQQFREMMDNGVFSNAPDLSELYSALQASPGYQQMIGLQMRDLFNSAQSPIMVRLHEHSLWANRHTSPEAQEVFDKRFGLVIRPSK